MHSSCLHTVNAKSYSVSGGAVDVLIKSWENVGKRRVGKVSVIRPLDAGSVVSR